MKITGEIKGKKAIIIDSERLKVLSNIIVKHCDNIEYSAETVAKTNITFESLDELLEYDNFKPRRIISVEMKGYSGYSHVVSIQIGNFNLSPFVNYGRTVKCYYQLQSIEAETIFKTDFATWYQKVQAPYWLVGKVSLFGLLLFPSIFHVLVQLIIGSPKAEMDISNPVVLTVFAVVCIAVIGFILTIKMVDAYILGNLFPAVVFNWGEEVNRNEKWERYRSSWLWGSIITILLGLLVNYLYDSLKILLNTQQ